MSLIRLYGHTLRHLRPGQATARAGLLLRRRLTAAAPDAARRWHEARAARYGVEWRECLDPDILCAPAFDAAGADHLLDHRYTFLKREVRFEPTIDWRAPDVPRLWRYHLHYMDALRQAASAWRATGDPRWAAWAGEVTRDWYRRTPLDDPDGWHPYVVATRVSNSVVAGAMMKPALESLGSWTMLVEQILVQVDYLRHRLEFDVLGNHLLRDLKALLMCGACFAGKAADRWIDSASRLLSAQLEEQVASDGGHYERSPHYHAIVLGDLIDAASTLEAFGRPPLPWLDETIDRMSRALAAMTHPDGSLALFNDGEQTTARSLSWLLDRRPVVGGRPAELPSLEVTGLFRLERDGDLCLFDAGEPSPPFLPAHAHCDLLSFELSLSGTPVIVNSGTYTYESGPWRQYFRSTRAHSTIAVDGAEQSEAWSAFRLARRARVRTARTVRTSIGLCLLGGHAGFTAPPVRVSHIRRIIRLATGAWVIADRLEGTGSHVIESRLHFAPRLEARAASREGALRLAPAGHLVFPFGFAERRQYHGSIEPREGWCSEEFGAMQPRDTVVWSATGSLPLSVGFVIVPAWIETGDPDAIFGPGWTLERVVSTLLAEAAS